MVDADEYARMVENGERHWWFRSTTDLLRQLIGPTLHRQRPNLFLDAAGGAGATGGWLTEIATTIDADMEYIALQAGAKAVPHYEPVQCDLNRLPFAGEAFSAVLCVTALCHRMNPDPAALVRDFARVAQPGAVIALMEPGGKRLWRGHDEVTHTGRRFSLGELKAMASDAGLEIVRATGAYTFLVPPAAIMTRFERGAATSDVGRNQGGVFGLLGLLARFERLLLRRISFPFGLSVIVIARKPSSPVNLTTRGADG